MNSNETIIGETMAFVKQTLQDLDGSHDWWHIERVHRMALRINEQEKAHPLVVELGALLHDIADYKYHHGNEWMGAEVAGRFLHRLGVEPSVIESVVYLINHLSFKGGHEQAPLTPELAVVQDADRLDALGAIGIARAFSYGGYKKRPFYDPSVPPNLHMSKEEYKQSQAPTLNHFYEKLLLLQDKMNTPTGKALAKNRHDFLLVYLDQFYAEWNGER